MQDEVENIRNKLNLEIRSLLSVIVKQENMKTTFQIP